MGVLVMSDLVMAMLSKGQVVRDCGVILWGWVACQVNSIWYNIHIPTTKHIRIYL